ncbi:DNA adenine methylase [Perlucidibaca piscinae]|uniref:DNA adenine methylase n=1 Tax=Perlucidibaca piscinae TaxID=392589 RepID=UPI001D17070B|nr:Dam family site-specific DNA-(adenine-N6)-methyltransferase [Perlucidibaca piscinae]
MEAQPIIKWAGGKRWLTAQASWLFPEKFNNYIEPFFGGGAVFFHLKPRNAIISDINKEIINVYTSIKKDWKPIIELLQIHQNLHSIEHYYEVRKSSPSGCMEKAARTLYLNRTCWNGLYRVNLKGEFNVPIGTKKNILIDIDSFPHVSNLLSSVEILCCDFEESINKSQDGDFVFIDPPYTVKHNYNGFIKYNESLFKWEDQIRLKNAVDRATERGAKVLVLNANHASVCELYEGYNQHVLSRSNVLAGKSEFRGKYQELAIQCWE